MIKRVGFTILTAMLFCLSIDLGVIPAAAQEIKNPSAEVVYHGGGCRKDSPPGYCCHAGSKPYHCH